MTQAQQQKTAERTEGATAAPGSAAAQKHAAERGEKLKAEMDSLLDEIDEVLEEEAETFVRSYVQKGGQ